jgi:biopolymer transport protein ExbD
MHGALTIKRGVERSWQAPLAVDSLLNYNMLAGCFLCLFVSLAHFTCFWTKLLESPSREINLPLGQATESEAATALASPASSVIEVHEDYSVTLDGRTVGTPFDANLHQLTSALRNREKDSSAAAPVVIHVLPHIKHARLVHVLNALERANTGEYVLLFTGQSQDDPVWKGRR